MEDPKAPNYELPEPPEYQEDLRIHENGKAVPMTAPVLVTDLDDPDADRKHRGELDQAFGVRPFFWKDQQLAPFAIDREGDWMRHRELLGEPDLKEIVRLPLAMQPDALRVIWFLAHDPAEWLSISSMVIGKDGEWIRLSAFDRAMKVEEKIRAWALQNVGGQEGPLIVNLFYDIFNSAHSTRAVSKPSDQHDEERAKN